MTKKIDPVFIIVITAFVILDLFVWYEMVFAKPVSEPQFYFLDVGQGDSELLVLPGNVKIMTDAGPSTKVSKNLEKIFSPLDRYIDIAVVSHPQRDHFGGFNNLLNRYRFGAFIVSGAETDADNSAEWIALREKIKEKGIPLIKVVAPDRIRAGAGEVDFISPSNRPEENVNLNDSGLVEYVKTGSFTALLTADTGFKTEKQLMSRFGIAADVLKVGHHGSKYSSGPEFLKAVDPKIAVIEVGAGNSYGHPAPETVSRLAAVGAAVLRTDQNGIMKIVRDGDSLKVLPVY